MDNCVEVTMANNESASQFPCGMRVLVVDDSVVCLKYVTLLLQKCGYQVTAKENSAEALLLLKQNEDNFDIVLTNVHMHEIDGFKLLEAGLEHDIPVIMISANDDLEIIKKGVRHGAVDYLVKPVRLGEIKNIWQHVYRKNCCVLSTRKDYEMPSDNGASKRGRRKSNGDGFETASKRDRVRWTPVLHTKFVDCVTKLGGVDKAVPLKILEMMGEKNITREKVASHLQKYRKAIKEMVGHDDGKKKVRRNSNSRPQRVVSEVPKASPDSRRHPIFENNITEGLLAVTPPVMMHQHTQFVASNEWMGVNDGVDQSLHPPQFMPGEVIHQCNMPFDRTTLEANSLPIVNHSVHPHHQQCHPTYGHIRSIYSDPRQHQHQHQHQHQSYGSDVRSAQETHDVFYGDIPHVSGNGSLLDVMLANDFFDQ